MRCTWMPEVSQKALSLRAKDEVDIFQWQILGAETWFSVLLGWVNAILLRPFPLCVGSKGPRAPFWLKELCCSLLFPSAELKLVACQWFPHTQRAIFFYTASAMLQGKSNVCRKGQRHFLSCGVETSHLQHTAWSHWPINQAEFTWSDWSLWAVRNSGSCSAFRA